MFQGKATMKKAHINEWMFSQTENFGGKFKIWMRFI